MSQRSLIVMAVVAGVAAGLFMPTGGKSPAPAAPTPVSPSDTTGSWDPINLEKHSDGHFYADVQINGQPIHCLIDTGASMVAIPLEEARRIGLSVSPDQFKPIGRGASGEVMGQPIMLTSVRLGKKDITDVRGAVLANNGGGLDICLLGQTFLSRIQTVKMVDNTMTLQ